MDKSIRAEQENFADTKRDVHIKDLLMDSSIISSNNFFAIKFDWKASTLEIRCRYLAHGNLGTEKNNVRKD